MVLHKQKFTVAEIEGTRCSIVATKVSEERAVFLKRLLEHNRYTVRTQKEADGSLTIGVTDCTFNALLAVYQKRLKTPEGRVVNPAYWDQRGGQYHIPYYLVQ